MSNQRYGSWREEDMEKAIFTYRNSDIGLNAVRLKYGIPIPTFKRHVEHKNVFANDTTKDFGRCSRRYSTSPQPFFYD